MEGIDYEYVDFDTEPFDSIEEYEEFRQINENFNCLRTSADWQKFWLRLDDHKNGYRRNLSDMEWTKLFSGIQGYRMGLWDIPEITADSLPDQFWRYYKQYQSGQINVSEFSRLMDCSRTSVYKYIRIAEKI